LEAVIGKSKLILITGVAGFIGMHLAKKLLEEGYAVLGVDNLNSYYDQNLKKNRIKLLAPFNQFNFFNEDIFILENIEKLFIEYRPYKVVNLAAQAGVRYSLINPHAYINTNIVGFMNILDCCNRYDVKNLIYASSSSVYGGNKKTPFSINHRTDKPISIYAVTKKSNELMAHSYSTLYGLRTTGLRFFTVYGPWGRPDMAMYIFANNMIKGKPIEVFNYGNMIRDFTFIDDIVLGIISAMKKNYLYEIFNLGNNKSEKILNVINLLEKHLGIRANIKLKRMQLGDVKETYANIDYERDMLDFNPVTSINEGIPKFVNWFKQYTEN